MWQGVEDKSQLQATDRLLRYARWVAAYPVLLARFLSAARPDAILLTYPAQIDVLVIWLAARVRNVPILLDLFISLYDTTVIDRRLARPGSLKARSLWWLEWLAVRRPIGCWSILPLTLATSRNCSACRMDRSAMCRSGRGRRVPRQHRARPSSRPQILFYGQLIPLHGIETVLAAATSGQGKAFDWTIIGSGQDAPKLASKLGDHPPGHIRWIPWVPYAELTGWIARSDICLGIFGGSRKAASVVPNKVYQALSCGRHVVTRSSPAMAELAANPGITLVEPESAGALLDGIDRALREGCPAPSDALVESFSFHEIGSVLAGYIDDLRRKEA